MMVMMMMMLMVLSRIPLPIHTNIHTTRALFDDFTSFMPTPSPSI